MKIDSNINVPFLIMDEDRYFSDGLRQILTTMCKDESVPDSGPRLVFFTPQTRKQLALSFFTSPSPEIRLVCIASKRVFPGTTCPGFPGVSVLHREDMPVTSWFNQLFKPVDFENLRTMAVLLNHREKEVIEHSAYHGPRRIGELMALSEKTVTIYKRQAMLKLGLESNEGIRQWVGAFGDMLNQPTVMTWSYSEYERITY